MILRDRIRELRRVPARELKPHPRNWRTHPPSQRAVLEELLADIGFAAALVAYELADGSLQLIDGHLRAELAPETAVPVLVLDVNDQEAERLLATLDPIAALAGTNAEELAQLCAAIDPVGESTAQLLADLQVPTSEAINELLPPERDVEESFQVLVECASEDEQRELHARLSAEGHRCRLLVL